MRSVALKDRHARGPENASQTRLQSRRTRDNRANATAQGLPPTMIDESICHRSLEPPNPVDRRARFELFANVQRPKVKGPSRSPQLASSGDNFFVNLFKQSWHGGENLRSHLAEIIADSS